MIICDTTAVNTGHKTGVVKRLQDVMTSKGYTSPQYIGCQHHVLDIILKHSMNEKLSMETTKPSLNYKFIDELKNSYEDLKKK